MSAAGMWLALVMAPAVAGVEVRVGAGLGLVADLNDRVSNGETRLRAGPSLVVPVRFEVSPHVRLRVDLNLETASGVDELTWLGDVDGVPVRRTDADGHLAIFGGLGLNFGLQASVPVRGPARPYLAAGGGLFGVGMYHALRDGTAVLLDPDQNDLGDPGNIDPYTLSVAGNLFVAGGVEVEVQKRVELWVEIGYSAALVGAAPLRKTPEAFDARREAFVWNPLRAGLGVTVQVDGRRTKAAEVP